VVPKASPSILPFTEEDEKTTIESGWEEEGSTTVEQGEVAEKIRSLGSGIEPKRPPPNLNITHITNNTGSSILDEPTVDDQRMNAALSMITPPSVLARLIVTQGNDSGQEIEVLPGKNYTIGRAIDNDVVLTDIAVSRKLPISVTRTVRGSSWIGAPATARSSTARGRSAVPARERRHDRDRKHELRFDTRTECHATHSRTTAATGSSSPM
jgi:hypothetical protein